MMLNRRFRVLLVAIAMAAGCAAEELSPSPLGPAPGGGGGGGTGGNGVVAADEFWKEVGYMHCINATKIRDSNGKVIRVEFKNGKPPPEDPTKPPMGGGAAVYDNTAECWVLAANVPALPPDGTVAYRYKIADCPGTDPKQMPPPTDPPGWAWFSTTRVNNMSAVFKKMSLPPTKKQFVLFEKQLTFNRLQRNLESPVSHGKRKVAYEAGGRNAAEEPAFWGLATAAYVYKDDNCPRPGRSRRAEPAGDLCFCEACEWSDVGQDDCGECWLQPPEKFATNACELGCIYTWEGDSPDGPVDECGRPMGDPACVPPDAPLDCVWLCLPEPPQ